MSAHDEFLPLLAGEMLGGLDHDETLRLEAHRAGCARCAEEAVALSAAMPIGERSSVSPFSRARMPDTQPRQLISAMTTVMSATTVAMAAKRYRMYLRVSALRRCAILMS